MNNPELKFIFRFLRRWWCSYFHDAATEQKSSGDLF